MEKFKFKFQKILDYREDIEEKSKEEFAKALRKYTVQEKKLNQLLEEKDNSVNAIKELKTSQDFQNFSRYVEYLDQKIQDARYRVHDAKEELEFAKMEMIKSTADRKVMDKLKDNAREEFNLESDRKEQKLNDDFALFSYMKLERR